MRITASVVAAALSVLLGATLQANYLRVGRADRQSRRDRHECRSGINR